MPRTLQLLPIPTGDEVLELIPRLRAALAGSAPVLPPRPQHDEAQTARLALSHGGPFPVVAAGHLVTGPGGFTRAQLESFRGAEVDDLVEPGVRLLFVGINPGLWTAAVNAHFARPGNRFWPALQLAGITPTRIDASRGLLPTDRAQLVGAGIGISNLVPFATARADELTAAQLRAAVAPLTALVRRARPRVVAVLGLTAYRQAFGDRKAKPGRQTDTLAGAELWVLPNPSGLNAHETQESLAAAYREAAIAAGVLNPTSNVQGTTE